MSKLGYFSTVFIISTATVLIFSIAVNGSDENHIHSQDNGQPILNVTQTPTEDELIQREYDNAVKSLDVKYLKCPQLQELMEQAAGALASSNFPEAQKWTKAINDFKAANNLESDPCKKIPKGDSTTTEINNITLNATNTAGGIYLESWRHLSIMSCIFGAVLLLA